MIMKKKIFNIIILLSIIFVFSSCTKMTNKMGLNFDSRFKDKNQHLYVPPFFEEDLYNYAEYKNIDDIYENGNIEQ